MEGGWHGIGRTPAGVRHFLGASASVAQPRIHIFRAPAAYRGQKNVLSGGATEPGAPRSLRGVARKCRTLL